VARESKQSTLTIRILGRDYPVSCPEDEREALLSSAEYLSQRMQAIRKKGKTLGVDRIAVMAALNIARELLALQLEVAQLRDGEDEPPFMQTSTATGVARDEDLDRRLDALQARIEAVLEDPD